VSPLSPAPSRGATWFEALTAVHGLVPAGPASVRVADARLGDEKARFLAVVPDPASRYPRARRGELGLEEGWGIAEHVRAALRADVRGPRRAIVAIVDVPSQAYGRNEELLGLHLACAAAVDAYATARLAGHPVIALLVGGAMSGAFLAHGYQASRILALDDPGVVVHAMGKEAAARVTRRTVADLEKLGAEVLPMSYEVRRYARLGTLHGLIAGVNAAAPTAEDVETVRSALVAAVADARAGAKDLSHRLASDAARETRGASLEVRTRMYAQWSET
jgi:malonate decarboxylase gamma subunit